MNRLRIFTSILIMFITLNSCGNEKKTNSKAAIDKVEEQEKLFSGTEIAKYTISAIMNQIPEIIKVDDNDGIFSVSYTRKDDGKRFEYKIKISENKVIWGNSDGRWREAKYDEKIVYSEKGNKLKITQTFEDGSKIVKEFTKFE